MMEISLFIKRKRIFLFFGVTGTGGAGKSSLIDELLLRFAHFYPDFKIALVSVDPTKKKSRGALLGDRIRLTCNTHPSFYIRSLATRDSHTELSVHIKETTSFLKTQDFDLIVVETSGIGQAADSITEISDKCLYVMTAEYGAQTQLEKIEMLESSDFIVINKFEQKGSQDAYRDVCKQYRRNHELFDTNKPKDEELPIFGTISSKFNNPGCNDLFREILESLSIPNENVNSLVFSRKSSVKDRIIPIERGNYLYEISKTCLDYNKKIKETYQVLKDYESLKRAFEITQEEKVNTHLKKIEKEIGKDIFNQIDKFKEIIKQYETGSYSYCVRGKEKKVETKYHSLSGTSIPKVGYPKENSLSSIYHFMNKTNLPGFFPFVAGVYPFKRTDEDPKRMFAGVGGPGRTNKRFHFLSDNEPVKRLSTAFDSITLYGEDPDYRPDIYGKIGEAGVSIASLVDMETLYSNFDLTHPTTSVSMTINGPAPIILAMFINVALKQKLKGKDFWDPEKRIEIIRMLRGTVQADILKEDQAQNTCIFSLEFSLKMMGDVQVYFSENKIRNYYTVSISGYHIAEAGANPLTQLAFTLANGFTYVEYYLSRGLHIDDFAENLSFFFSNGLDPEYTVIGRVARKIWAVVMKERYGANLKSQKFKYHVQTSGRSLHAQEISFNDIRTTLQALIALGDSCNSLHTNAYDEAITTPTEKSVRRAMAIQMIINKEFGLNKTDNPFQGSYLIEELHDMVEENVLGELESISERGGVMGAMERMYQRGKIQEESLYYERLKDRGELPIIGVNVYKSEDEEEVHSSALSRCSNEEKDEQIKRLEKFKKEHQGKSTEAIERLKKVALEGGNIFEELLYTVNFCSLGEITNTLFEIGGRYRRNM